MDKIRNLNINKKAVTKLILGLGLSGVIILSSKTINNINMQENIDEPSTTIEYAYDDYESTSSNNISSEFERVFNASPELVEEFSDVYPQIAEFISTYEEYFDESLIKSLETLNVEKSENNDYPDTVLAVYDYKKNTIFLKEKIKVKKESQIKELKEHELFHFIFGEGLSQGSFNVFKTGHSIDEGFVTLLTQETGDYAETVLYKKNANYVRVLCELIGMENFLDAYTNNSLNDLYNYLSQYMSMSEAKELIKNIDEACMDYGIIKTEADKKAWEIIEKAYKHKTGVSIKDGNDPIMKYYSNKISGTAYSIEGARSYLDINIEKNYFLNINTPRVVFEHDGEEYGEIIFVNNGYVLHMYQNKTK